MRLYSQSHITRIQYLAEQQQCSTALDVERAPYLVIRQILHESPRWLELHAVAGLIKKTLAIANPKLGFEKRTLGRTCISNVHPSMLHTIYPANDQASRSPPRRSGSPSRTQACQHHNQRSSNHCAQTPRSTAVYFRSSLHTGCLTPHLTCPMDQLSLCNSIHANLHSSW